MTIFALRYVVDLPFLERRISVNARNALAALETTVANRLLMSTRNF